MHYRHVRKRRPPGTSVTKTTVDMPPMSARWGCPLCRGAAGTGSTLARALLCVSDVPACVSILSELPSSLSIFLATWSRRLPGSLSRNRCLKSRPGGSPAGRHVRRVLIVEIFRKLCRMFFHNQTQVMIFYASLATGGTVQISLMQEYLDVYVSLTWTNGSDVEKGEGPCVRTRSA